MKKKLLLIGLVFGLTHGYAQKARTKVVNSINGTSVSVPVSNVVANADAAPEVVSTSSAKPLDLSSASVSLAPGDTVIGSTIYTTVSNASTGRLLARLPDGKMAAYWMISKTPGYADRGTGTNFYNGTTWENGSFPPAANSSVAGPAARIESFKTGFGNIALSASREIAFSHKGAVSGMSLSTRTTGTGAWTTTTILPSTNGSAPDWPRSGVTADGQSIHAIYVYYWPTGDTTIKPAYGGSRAPFMYAKSTDAGVTWTEGPHPAFDTSTIAGIKQNCTYDMDVRGNTVAIIEGYWGNHLILAKSTDNGVTWTKKIINYSAVNRQVGYKYYWQVTGPQIKVDIDGDSKTDTLEVPDGNLSVALDKNNMAHVVYGTRVLSSNVNDTLVIFSPEHMVYWNEAKDPEATATVNGNAPGIAITHNFDLNNNGKFDIDKLATGSSFGGGLPPVFANPYLSRPSIGLDDNGDVYVAYDAIVEFDSTKTNSYVVNAKLFRHVYVTKLNGTSPCSEGSGFSLPIDVTQDPYAEGVYAALPTNLTGANGAILTYMKDDVPGTCDATTGTTACTDPDNFEKPVFITMVRVPAASFVCPPVIGIAEKNGLEGKVKVLPNPAQNNVFVSINAERSGTATVEILNVVGQRVSSLVKNLNAGTNEIRIDIEGNTPGIYFVKTSIAGNVNVQKLVIE